jgi:ParB family chromosome partitioning protein
MRMPWAKSKGEQLDLLDSEPVVGVAAMPAKARPSSQAGQPLFVAMSALHEDPCNPRTELPEDELAELTEDIRQRGILQPIVVHPVDGDGRYRIHFGARRWRAAQLAGLDQVPVVVRDAPADPYAQVAENQKRHGLTPLDLARFIRGRVDLGESNSEVARRLGMNLTTVAHHLSLLDLPPVLGDALKAGQCTSPRTLHELSALHDRHPEHVEALLEASAPISREAVKALRARVDLISATDPVRLIGRAMIACERLETLLAAVGAQGTARDRDALRALRARLAALSRWSVGESDGQTP